MRLSGRRPPKVHVALALALGLVVVLCIGCGTSGEPLALTENAAQSNLQTALTGGGVFYASNQDSFTGIGGGPLLSPGVFSISELGTGLKYVSGHKGSTDSNIVSIYAPGRAVLLLTAYEPGLRTCWGILSLRRSRSEPYFPAYPDTAHLGTFYLRGASSRSRYCAASRVVPSALSKSGFPAT